VEEAAGERRLAKGLHAAGAGALAEDHNVIRVATELGDILLDPFQGLDLVEDTIVAGYSVRALSCKLGVSQEAENAETIVDRHKDNVPCAPLFGVELRL
jgi:hypothetical protein